MVRNYSGELFEKLVDFYRETVGGVFLSGKNGPRFLEKILQKPHFDPGRDLFVAEMGNAVSGLLRIYSEFRIKRIVLNCHVHHNFSYRNVASSLLEKGLQRCREIGGDMMHICLPENFSAGRKFFERSGFSPVRIHAELERDLREALSAGIEPEIGHVGRFDEGDELRLTELQNRIFTSSWGFSPNSVEEIEYYLDLTQSKVSDVLLLKEGEEPIGYFWAHASLMGDTNKKRGRIHMFGIAPEFQGRGLGKKLLRIGLQDMRDKDYRTVELTVDEENRPARSLYDSTGFREKFASLWYERSLQLRC